MRTRFAPSPTGPLHLGHAYSAMLAHDMARAAGGEFLLRIEDIDQTRARPEYEGQIYDDLHWLGLNWPRPVMRQSDRLPTYRRALSQLWARGLIYPCTCTRRDISDALNAPQEGAAPTPHIGPDGPAYPGTCRKIPAADAPMPEQALRLNMALALAVVTGRPMARPLEFTEQGAGPQGETENINIDPQTLMNAGDIVLARRDFGTSYHLAVVLDDATQGITHITRGNDLFDATAIHILLQNLLGLATPVYHHHRLIRDENGKRLAKRDDARAIAKYRADGETKSEIRQRVGL